MNTTYHYVVLRLAPDAMRGELINVGIALFPKDGESKVITMATLNKLRAIDDSWDSSRLSSWTSNIQTILTRKKAVSDQLRTLEMFGFCEANAAGMFSAGSEEELAKRIREIKVKYVANKARFDAPKREKRTRLQTALRDQFKRMHVLGTQAGDLAEHLVVANVPVPGHDELKNDFVYKNGIYRLTQTLDYNVALDSLHNKLAEACVKSTAAEMAARAYGENTLKMVVVDVPPALEDAADSHIDLLHARGFEIFRFNDSASMSSYMQKAVPSVAI